MNPRRCDDHDYILLLIAAQTRCACAEAGRWPPEKAERDAAPSHDAFIRLPADLPPDTESLRREAQGVVDRNQSCRVPDDSILDQFHA